MSESVAGTGAGLSLANATKPLNQEAELIRQAQKGDRAAFATAIDPHYDRLYRWLFHMCRDPHLAEDLVQETLLKAYSHLRRFQAGTNFSAWLFRIAHNNLINQHRSKKQQNVLEESIALEKRPGPEEALEQQEALEQIAKAIERLPEEFRAAFLLRVDEDLSFREIAQVMGLTEETARWRVYKARQKLMKALAPSQELERS